MENGTGNTSKFKKSSRRLIVAADATTKIFIRYSKQEKGNKLTMMKHIIGYFSITIIPKVTIFGDKSTRIQFYGQWR